MHKTSPKPHRHKNIRTFEYALLSACECCGRPSFEGSARPLHLPLYKENQAFSGKTTVEDEELTVFIRASKVHKQANNGNLATVSLEALKRVHEFTCP